MHRLHQNLSLFYMTACQRVNESKEEKRLNPRQTSENHFISSLFLHFFFGFFYCLTFATNEFYSTILVYIILTDLNFIRLCSVQLFIPLLFRCTIYLSQICSAFFYSVPNQKLLTIDFFFVSKILTFVIQDLFTE